MYIAIIFGILLFLQIISCSIMCLIIVNSFSGFLHQGLGGQTYHLRCMLKYTAHLTINKSWILKLESRNEMSTAYGSISQKTSTIRNMLEKPLSSILKAFWVWFRNFDAFGSVWRFMLYILLMFLKLFQSAFWFNPWTCILIKYCFAA